MTLTTDAGHVTVRMYNVGFGDAFLLVFPGADRPRRMLVDCGSHAAGPGPRPMAEVVASIIADVTDDDGVARIDVVVGTHRHRDHVSGFADEHWGEVVVGEVWMPWTEHPRDAKAKRIRERQAGIAHALALALEAPGASETAQVLAANALPNAKAMQTLHSGFAGRPKRRFLPLSDTPVTEVAGSPLAAAGVEVHALGPARDEAIIRDMDPPTGAGYLRLVDAAVDGADPRRSPFGPQWAVGPQTLAKDARRKRVLLGGQERRLIEEAAEIDLFGIAVALEKAINGTSLVLSVRQGDAVLLLPADAQWGTWKRMLESPDASEQLAAATFFKVGHHGSHNATPRAFVELLGASHPPEDVTAVVSTRGMKLWKQIPEADLMTALGKVAGRLERSDTGADHIDVLVPLSG